MTFCIQVVEHSVGQFRGEIQFDSEIETFPLVITRWHPSQYESQWHDALAALTSGRVRACVLITDIQPPLDSAGLMYWALFKEGPVVFSQERFVREDVESFLAAPEKVEASIPPRVQGSMREQALISEWMVTLEEISDFLALTSSDRRPLRTKQPDAPME
jgi:CdiI N-terminal domain